MGDNNQQNNLLKKEKSNNTVKFESNSPSIIEKRKSEKIGLVQRDFVSLLLYGHISKLNDFIPSLFGCEEWLRKEFKIILKLETVKEIFYAW